jgi:hypothetical protein
MPPRPSGSPSHIGYCSEYQYYVLSNVLGARRRASAPHHLRGRSSSSPTHKAEVSRSNASDRVSTDTARSSHTSAEREVQDHTVPGRLTHEAHSCWWAPSCPSTASFLVRRPQWVRHATPSVFVLTVAQKRPGQRTRQSGPVGNGLTLQHPEEHTGADRPTVEPTRPACCPGGSLEQRDSCPCRILALPRWLLRPPGFRSSYGPP